MKNIEKIKSEAINAYHESSPETQKQLLEIFNSEIFKPETNWLQVYHQACEEFGLDNNFVEGLTDDEKAYQMIKRLIKHHNGDWIPDYNNSKQYKWWPYFDMSNSGFAFAYSDFDWATTNTRGGSRFALKSQSVSDLVGKKYITIFKVFYK